MASPLSVLTSETSLCVRSRSNLSRDPDKATTLRGLFGRTVMRYVRKVLVTALMASTMLVAAAEAKTLVYCSEGSPENFNPQINTTGTSLDAARHIYNQLTEFAPGDRRAHV